MSDKLSLITGILLSQVLTNVANSIVLEKSGPIVLSESWLLD